MQQAIQRHQWQTREVESFGLAPKRAIFASPRIGKTLAALDTLRAWNVDRAIVVAPVAVCAQWAVQLTGHVVNMYSGTKEQRLGQFSLAPETGKVTVVINYDVLTAFVDDLIAWKPQAIIGDESHLIKGVSTDRAKAFRRLAWRTKYVRLLTGTPSPNHYGDLWGQLVALDRDAWQSYGKFAERYLIRHPVFPSKVIGHRNVDELQERILKYASIVRREDEFGPDTWQEITRKVILPKDARKVYDKLAREWFLEDENVNATHILKRLVRLQQIAAGFLPGDDGKLTHVHEAKVDAVRADLGEIVECGEKAVIFHMFTWEGQTYAKLASGMCKTFVIDGSVSAQDRLEITDSFRDHEGSCIAVVQIRAGGVGISFAEATHALFASRDFSYATDQQARDRIYKRGARRVVTTYECDRTVDQYVSKILRTKSSVHESVTRADKEAMAYGMIA